MEGSNITIDIPIRSPENRKAIGHIDHRSVTDRKTDFLSPLLQTKPTFDKSTLIPPSPTTNFSQALKSSSEIKVILENSRRNREVKQSLHQLKLSMETSKRRSTTTTIARANPRMVRKSIYL